jgi:catechol 2,3-dioxygenase-like lactoylglutathione lyase family enzyme
MTEGSFLGVLEAAVYAADIDAAEAFYAGVLGLPVIARRGNRHVFFRVGATILLVFNPKETRKAPANAALPVPPHGAQGPGHVCLSARPEEMENWRRRLEGARVAIEANFRWPNGARSLYFRDPAGNSVEIAEPRLWS